jgi:hypothetical protein
VLLVTFLQFSRPLDLFQDHGDLDTAIVSLENLPGETDGVVIPPDPTRWPFLIFGIKLPFLNQPSRAKPPYLNGGAGEVQQIIL